MNEDRTPEESPIETFVATAESRARENPAGIGAAVVNSTFSGAARRWETIVSDGREWHYVTVLGPEVGAHPDISSQNVERGVERFAATLPADGRLRALLNANPLHIDGAGAVRD
jgi:hypothetical protein